MSWEMMSIQFKGLLKQLLNVCFTLYDIFQK
jgi:hypothetical protein